MPEKKSNRGGPRTAGPGKRNGRPPKPVGERRVVIQPSVLPVTELRLAALIMGRHAAGGPLVSQGQLIDELAKAAHPGVPQAP